MSYTDPLIKDLKAALGSLMDSEVISDVTPGLARFCDVLEQVFGKGLLPKTLEELSPWGWMNAVAMEMENSALERVFPYVRSVEETRACRRVSSSVGKFRQLVRCCLKYKCLHVPVDVLVRQIGNQRCGLYQPTSVLGDEIMGEIVLSVLMQASHLNFSLDTTNSRFLDLTWQLPEIITHTFVPCATLGLVITFHADFAVVVSVERGSVAEEDEKIEPGDVIDELNGTILTRDLHGSLKNIFSRSRVQPITARIVKIHCRTPTKAFEPCLQLYGKIDRLKTLCKPSQKTDRPQRQELNYLGCSSVGRRGEVRLIKEGIMKVKTENPSKPPVRVSVDCREMDVVVYTGEEVLMRHPFVQIASCGHSPDYPKHFAYIVGNGPCSSSVEYTCHVFEASSLDICSSILLGLKLGFDRTQFTV